MSGVSQQPSCPACDAPLAPDAPGGMCPRCLVARALDPDDGEDPDPPAANEQGRGTHLAGGTTPPAGTPSSLGSIGGYDVIEEIARGGMGVVYKAHQPRLGRFVALKVLSHGPAGTPEARRRFEIEAEAVAGLAHPHIVPIYETGVEEGMAFFSMKLIEGETLDRALAGKPLPGREAAVLMRKIAGAVHYAHQHGVLHRDLKPQNILLDADGEPHLTDFGLAKVAGQDTRLTLSGAVLGTPAYMSPEQAAGGTRDLATTSDLYSLGAVFYEMLTGHPPHTGASVMEILKAVSESEPTAPRQLHAGVDRDLETIALKCLEKDPARRYASGQGLVDDLDRWLRGEPIAARPVNTIERVVKWTRRRPMRAAAAGLAVLLLLTLGIGGPLVAVRQASLRAEADAARVTAVQREAETRRALARSAMSLADAALREGDGRAMRRVLDTVPEDLRDSTWRYLSRQSDTSRTAFDLSARIGRVAVVGDPRRPGVFAVSDAMLSVKLLHARSGERLLEFSPRFQEPPSGMSPGNYLTLAFSPDGERLAVGICGRVWDAAYRPGVGFYDPRSGEKLDHWDAPQTDQLQFSPDGTKMIVRSQSRLRVRDAADGRCLWENDSKKAPRDALFTPDSRFVVRSDTPGVFEFLDAGDGSLVRSSPRPARDLERVIGTSGLIAVNADDGIVTVYDSATGERVTRIQHPTGAWGINHLTFTPDGEQLVTSMAMTDGREAIRVWNARTGFLVRSLLGGRSRNLGMAVHPLSGELLVCGDHSRVWDLTGVPPRWIIPQRGRGEITFWGNDETVITSEGVGILSPEGGGLSLAWSAKGNGFGNNLRQPHVSADGRVAAIPNCIDTVVVLDRADGVVNVKKTMNGPMQQWVGARARLSPEGGQAMIFWRTQSRTPLHWYSCETGKPAGEVERRNIFEVHDLCWLSERRLVGLVTTDALRTDGASSEHVALWDMPSGRILHMEPHASAMDALAREPGGTRFAEAGVDKMVRIRDGGTLEVLHEFRAHDGPVVRLAWHPSRPVLATTATDWSYRLWDVETGEMLEEMRGPLSLATSLAFSPSGRRLAATDGAGTVRIWEPQALRE